MREDVKTRISSAGGALATAVVLGALQAGKLGSFPFSFQVSAAAVGVAWMPCFYRTGLLTRLPKFMLFPIALVWTVTCFAPAVYALLIELFTGHRRPGMSWYDALWRIYAILVLWIGVAALNERIVRPWWRENSDRIMSPFRSQSVAGQAHKLASDKRTQILDALKGRLKIAARKKILAQRSLQRKSADIEKAKASIERATVMVEKARKRSEECAEPEKAEAKDVVSTMSEMLESAKSAENNLHSDVERLKLELEEIQMQLDSLQQEWTEALHIQNHTGFFR